MGTYSSILAWRIPWTEEPGGLYSLWDHKGSDMTELLTYTLIKQLIQQYHFINISFTLSL